MTRHHGDDSNAINASADYFLADAKREMGHHTPEEILNSDQVGLELEIHSTRTLPHTDEHVT